MNVEKERQILTHWGATSNQIESILPRTCETEMQQREQHIIAIDEYLRLLYRKPSEQQAFMNRVNKSVFFYWQKTSCGYCIWQA